MGRFIDEGNILVLNQSKNVLINYNFMLRVEGIYDLPCKSVHSFTKENEFEYVQEGGLNDYVHMLRKPVSKPFSFTVERYVGMDIIPPLALGAELILPVILMVAPNANRFDNAKRTFVFTGCTVMSKTYGELNAEKSGLLTETIVIGYREMVEVTIPVHEGSAGKLWKFDGSKNGNGERSANTRETKTDTPKVRRYLIKEGQEGTTVKSAKTYTDIYGEEMKKADPNTLVARKWPEKRSAKDGGLKNTAPKVRRYLIKKGQKGISVKSAKTYADIYGEEMKKADPKTLIARKLLEKRMAKVIGLRNTAPKVRRYLIKRGQEGTSVKSAQTYNGEEMKKADQNTLVTRKWPEVSSAKPGVDTKEVKKRRWKPDVSAKPGVDTKEVKKRRWKPDVSAKPGAETGKAESRKWPPTQSAKK